MSRYAVIMAGGPGTRLWPMSRRARPKQLLPFGPGGKSLLRTSVERLEGLFAHDDIYVIAGQGQLAAIRNELPELPAENLIGEPCPRDTANAIGLACAILARKDPNATIGVFTADHIIEPRDLFQTAVDAAMQQIEARSEYLGTFGIKPSWADPGLGYVHRGEKLADGPVPAFDVKAFKEKPDTATAEAYLESGEYYWNSGMFVWKAETIVSQLKTFLPKNTAELEALAEHFGTSDFPSLASETYSRLEKISIDFAVMEKAKKVLVVELTCNWADVGNWSELKNVTGTDENGNATLAQMLLTIDCCDDILISSDKDHLLAVIGAKNLIVVHTPDATLICDKAQAQKIKELVARIEQEFAGKYT